MMFYELLYGRHAWSGVNRNELIDNIEKKPVVFP